MSLDEKPLEWGVGYNHSFHQEQHIEDGEREGERREEEKAPRGNDMAFYSSKCCSNTATTTGSTVVGFFLTDAKEEKWTELQIKQVLFKW